MKSFLDWLVEAAMTLSQALEIFGISEVPSTEKELLALWKKLALQKHPDHGGSTIEMQKLNAAKDFLKKHLSSKDSKTSSEHGKSSPADELHQRAELATGVLERLFIRLDTVSCRNWLEKHFGKKFVNEIRRGIQTGPIDGISFPYVEMTSYPEDRSVIFTLKLEAAAFKKGKNVSFGYYASSSVFINGKTEDILKKKAKDITDTMPLMNPGIMLPSTKLKKIVKVIDLK